MAKHEVTCVKCGRRFDYDKEGGQYYPDSRRYACKKCVNAQKKRQKERFQAEQSSSDERETSIKKAKTAMIVKIVIGILFLISSFTLIAQGNIPAFIVGLVIAAALIAWGAVPYFKADK